MSRNSHDLRWTFLPRDAMHKRGLCIYAVMRCLSVCLSECVSATFVSCITRSSAIADKPRDAGLYSCLGMAGLFVSICRQKVHEHMLQTVN